MNDDADVARALREQRFHTKIARDAGTSTGASSRQDAKRAKKHNPIIRPGKTEDPDPFELVTPFATFASWRETTSVPLRA